MGDRLRRLPSPSMAVAFVALLAALGGTAVALPGTNTVDSGDIKNSNVKTQDIRNSTIRGKDVRNDTLTGADVLESSLGTVPSAARAGSAGSADTATTAGSANTANTANTAARATSASDADGLGGEPASGFLRAGSLRSGQTLTGAYMVAYFRAAGQFVQGTPISFPIPLAAGPAVTYRPPGSTPNAACPGTTSSPQAEPGRLCVYGSRQDHSAPSIEAQSGGRTGFRIFGIGPDNTNTQIDGTWAVTAP